MRVSDELNQKIEKAEKTLEKNNGSTYKSEGFKSIEPFNEFGYSTVVIEEYIDRMNAGDSIELQKIISAFDSADVRMK